MVTHKQTKNFKISDTHGPSFVRCLGAFLNKKYLNWFLFKLLLIILPPCIWGGGEDVRQVNAVNECTYKLYPPSVGKETVVGKPSLTSATRIVKCFYTGLNLSEPKCNTR